MTILIALEKDSSHEVQWVNTNLAHGLQLFHVRKHHFNKSMMLAYVRSIEQKYHSRLVLHSHYHLAEQFGINRLHFNETKRLNKEHVPYQKKFKLSTSIHSMETFNALGDEWDYAFLSPLFPSISKPGYGTNTSLFAQLKNRTNTAVKLIGLGGISPKNALKTRQAGVDGIALMGSVWQSKNPLKTVQQCL